METAKPGRLTELDVLRGLAVAGMILVNTPGDWGAVYPLLEHAPWNGFTIADTVFPTFLFSAGFAVSLAFPLKWETREQKSVFTRGVIRRVLSLIGLGLALAALGMIVSRQGFDLGHLRLAGVLQRIGVCYGLAILLLVLTARRAEGRLHLNRPAIAIASAVILVSYWLVMTLVPVPGFGAGRLDAEGNLAAFIDRAVFTIPHLWSMGSATPGGPVVYDPEGLLSTVPAVVNVLFGVLVGDLWRRDTARAPVLVGIAGLIAVVVGVVWGLAFPVNKALWTSSFVLVSGGVSALIASALGFLLRHRWAQSASFPLKILGGNAIAAYVLSQMVGEFYGLPVFARGASVQSGLNGGLLALTHNPELASALAAVVFVALITLILWPFHTRGLRWRL